MTTLPWFQAMTIDGTPRRAFFERVREARPPHGVFDIFRPPDPDVICNDCGFTDNAFADLCRASADRWARKQMPMERSMDTMLFDYCTGIVSTKSDDLACSLAHRLADELGVEP